MNERRNTLVRVMMEKGKDTRNVLKFFTAFYAVCHTILYIFCLPTHAWLKVYIHYYSNERTLSAVSKQGKTCQSPFAIVIVNPGDRNGIAHTKCFSLLFNDFQLIFLETERACIAGWRHQSGVSKSL